MAYPRNIALHDEILIDGTDASNAFRAFGFSSEHTSEDVSGFSVTGFDETLAGRTAQTLKGEAFYTPESYALLYPLHANREVFPIQWQPEGLTDSTRETYVGNVQLLTFNPEATRGSVRVMTCTFVAADEDGITATTGS
jgi:hypothetical protein